MRKVYSQPSEVEADPNRVKITGPDAVKVDMTPEAAVRTAGRLVAGSAEAIAKAKRTKKVH